MVFSKGAEPRANRFDSADFYRRQELAGQKAYHDGKQGGTFYKRCRQDHVVADIAYCFRLACDGVHCAATDKTNADSGAQGCDSCSNCSHFSII
jgi:hypothetical protein